MYIVKPRRKANWIGHILRKHYLLHDANEGQMMKGKGVGRTQLLDDLRNRRKYRKLKIEKYVNHSLSIEHKEEIQGIFHKFMGLLIYSIHNNNPPIKVKK